jgi:signal-transduction protein with cAMP-binding, CBS, and nucleotidyltransferase domain
MFTIHQLMQEKGEQAFSVGPQATVQEALLMMAEKNTGAVMIVEDQGQMIGIFTERDYARKVIQKGKCSLDTPVQEIMTSNMITIGPESNLEECMNLMSEHHIRHLPVMHAGRLIGMVSMRDVVETILSRKDDTIINLENYILGTDYGK